MRDETTYRALVVDDDDLARQVTTRVLQKEGFSCDEAVDGVDALQQISGTNYDIVVTDLKMPNKHGHALCLDLLARKERPLVVVVTGVIEPRLAKDLTLRGVDDIVFKPIDYHSFAAKTRARVDRHHQQRADLATAASEAEKAVAKPPSNPKSELSDLSRISMEELENKLALLAQVMPISETAVQVFSMTSSGAHGASQIAAVIECDPSLAAEVLRLANSSFYNASGIEITRLESGVARIGQKRIGELALATHALRSLTGTMLPFLDISCVWKQSVAAGLASELLISQGGHEKIAEGVFLNAIMHQLGRIVLGTLYPAEYENMVGTCTAAEGVLTAYEQGIFPENHAKVMARLLGVWNIPAELHRPLGHTLDAYESLRRLPEPTRTKTELVKLATLLGQIAAGAWAPWDAIELPPSTLLSRLRISNVKDIIEETRSGLEHIVKLQPSFPSVNRIDSNHDATQSRSIEYCNLATHTFDFVSEIVSSMGINLTPASNEIADWQSSVLVNCFEVAPLRLIARLKGRSTSQLVLVTDGDNAFQQGQEALIVRLPCSYARLRRLASDASHASGVERATTSSTGHSQAINCWA